MSSNKNDQKTFTEKIKDKVEPETKDSRSIIDKLTGKNHQSTTDMIRGEDSRGIIDKITGGDSRNTVDTFLGKDSRSVVDKIRGGISNLTGNKTERKE